MCDILDVERRRAAAGPVVDGQPAGDVQRHLAFRQQQFAQRRAHGAEGHRLEALAIGGGYGAADVVAARRISIDHAVGRKREYGCGMGGAIGPRLFEKLDQFLFEESLSP